MFADPLETSVELINFKLIVLIHINLQSKIALYCHHQWTVIWLHGLGADGNDFVPVARALGLETVRYVFPNAPISPVTLNHGMKMRSWYDIRTLDVVPDRESYDDVLASAEAVDQLIEQEASRLGG